MRCLMTAGEALKRENIAGYNCSYVAVSRIQAFDEILYGGKTQAESPE